MIGQKLAGRYEIMGELGRGGMGVVYRAFDPLLEREVAIKMVPPNLLSEENQERLQREAKLVAAMDHPCIVPVHDISEHEGGMFFVMPVVTGTSLRNLIRANAIGIRDMLEIGIQVSQALEYSHSRGVLHRDIKPDNIMIPGQQKEEFYIRVMDFGLARADVQSRITQSGVLVGTMYYLSPEQIVDREMDARSDLYSLGTVLYECLAGKPPFTGDFHAVLHQIVYEEPPPFPSRDTPVFEIEDLILSCLAKDPEKRPQRAHELTERLMKCQVSLNADQLQSRLTAPIVEPEPIPEKEMPLIGRKREMNALESRLDHALQEECQFILLEGEEGVGKGRLLEEFEKNLVRGQARVLRGRFLEKESGFPFYGFCEIIQDFFRVKNEDDPPSGTLDFSDLAPDLIELFPVLMEIPALSQHVAEDSRLQDPRTGRSSENKFHVFELLARTLTRLGSTRLLVLFLEDLHLGDASVEALPYLLRRLAPTRTLLVGTYRPEGVDRSHPLWKLQSGLQGDRNFLKIKLPPLTPSEHRSLLAALLGGLEISDTLARRLYDATDGNPFFTKDLVQTLHDFKIIGKDDSGSWYFIEDQHVSDSELPATIRQSVDRRIHNLEPELQDILIRLSILGRSFDYKHVEYLFGNKLDLDEIVDRLLELGLLEEIRQAREDRLSFSSGVVREVLYGRLTRRKRKRYHRQFAEQLEKEHKGHLERICSLLYHHFLHSEVPEKVVQYGLMTGKNELNAHSSRDAVQTLNVVIDFIADERWESQPELEGEAFLLMAQAQKSVGDLNPAILAAEKAVARFAICENGEKTAEATLLAAATAWEARRIKQAIHWVREGIRITQGTEFATRKKLLSLGATLENLRGEHDQARSYLAEIAAMTGAETEEDLMEQGGDLVIGVCNTVSTMDPAKIVTVEGVEVFGNVFETLISVDDHGNLHPGLCRNWDVGDEGRSLVLELEEKVTFHDGHPLTAAAVKRSFERAIQIVAAAEVSSSVQAAFRAIRGVGESNRKSREGETPAPVTGIVPLSEHRLRIDLTDPLPIFPALLTNFQTSITRVPDRTDSRLPLVGTGPFLVGDRDHSHIRLERFSGHWKTTSVATLDRLEFRLGLKSSDVGRDLRLGKLDLARDLEPGDLEMVLRDPRFRSGLTERPQKQTAFMIFNSSSPAVSNPRVRQVLSQVLRVHDLVWSSLGRFAQPATGLIPPGILGHHPGRRFVQGMTVKEAARVLEEEGIRTPFQLRAVAHPAYHDVYRGLLRLIFEAWKEIGVEVSLADPSIEEFLRQAEENEGLDLWIGRWTADYDDPDNFTHGFFHSARGVLRKYYSTEEFDSLAEQARVELDSGVREDLYLKMEKLLVKTATVVPLFHAVDYRVANPRLRGVRLIGGPPYVSYHQIAREKARPADPRPDRHRDQIIEVPMAGTSGPLDPAAARSLNAFETLPNIFETLTRVGDGVEVRPWLASSFHSEAGDQEFVFRLRDDVRFHNGRRLTSRDVRYSLERALRLGGDGQVLLPLTGAETVVEDPQAGLKGMQIKSSTEFTLRLDHPVAFFPLLLSHPATAIIPEGSGGSEKDRAPLSGTGPFRIGRFVAKERLELEANPFYWRKGFPRATNLIYTFNLESDKIGAGFQSGRYSLALDLDHRDVDKLRRDSESGRGCQEIPGLNTGLLQFNTKRGALRDEELRQRLFHALDVPGVLSRVSQGRLEAASTFIPPALLGHQSPRSHSPGAVRSGDHLKGLRLKAAVLPYPKIYARLARELFQTVHGQGVRIRVVNRTVPEFFDALKKGDVDLVLGRWCAHYPDADSFFFQLFDSKVGYLREFYSPPEVQRLIALGRREKDPNMRRSIYLELEDMLSKNAVLLPLFHEQVYRFALPGLEGLKFSFSYPTVAYENLSL